MNWHAATVVTQAVGLVVIAAFAYAVASIVRDAILRGLGD